MKHMRATVFLLACAAMLPTALSCSDQTAEDTKTTESVTETGAGVDSADPLEARKLIPDNLPEADYNGYVFRIATNDDGTSELLVEEETGDITEDAIYYRNQAVEERFNCEIEIVIDEAYYETSSWINQQVTAGDDVIDLICRMSWKTQRWR